MCGIAGFIAGHGAANAAALAPMLARIAHRGPDGQGTFVEGPAALGHCRLAIIDLEGGAQPLYSEDKNLVVVFNGEIYNYRALTAELTALGHTFATRTDTEVLLHGWEQWGRELLPRLRGMFAFALWDRRAGVLFCARDMFGIKPLYYCRCADGTLLFASEIKAFLDHPSFAKRLNTAQLPLYLSCQYSPGRDTFFAGVQKLLPGHFLEFSDGIVRTTRWVQPAFLPGDAPVSPAEIEEVLRGSAAAHKVADVEVAGFLSGGVDSAYLTALARPARTYTISYAEPKYDESFPARALARSLGVRNRVRRISPGEFWDAVPAVQYHMDEPLADAAAKADARTTKIALRRAAARTLPAASAARKKLGFPVPVRDWLRQEPYTSRVRAVFSRPAAAEFFDPRALHSMLNQHLHGGDCWRQIWCVYSFLIWYEQFFGA